MDIEGGIMKHDCLAKESVYFLAYKMVKNKPINLEPKFNYYILNQWPIKICYDY